MCTIDEYFVRYGGYNIDGIVTLDAPVYTTAQRTLYLKSPGIVVLAYPQVRMHGLSGFLSGYQTGFDEYLNDPVELSPASQLCKVAGQLCYMSFGKKRTRNEQADTYFNNLKASGHGSVLEHANFSLLLYGVSRSTTHELVRHRAGIAISQQSQRYVSGKMLRFVERPEYQQDMYLHAHFLERIDRIKVQYENFSQYLLTMQEGGNRLLQGEARTDLRKKVQQTARSILPNETEAPLVMTGNVRAWRHILSMRANAHAETEIRSLAVRIFLCLYRLEPLLFEDFTLEQLTDGTLAVQTPFVKV